MQPALNAKNSKKDRPSAQSPRGRGRLGPAGNAPGEPHYPGPGGRGRISDDAAFPDWINEAHSSRASSEALTTYCFCTSSSADGGPCCCWKERSDSKAFISFSMVAIFRQYDIYK